MKHVHTFFRHWSIAAALAAITFLAACDDDDPPAADNEVSFESEALGFEADESSVTININLAHEASQNGTVDIQATSSDLKYGTDYTTEPAMNGSTLTLPIAAGAKQVSFVLKKSADALLDGDEKITFSVTTNVQGLTGGDNTSLEVSFAEILAAQGTLDPNVGGQLQPNKVFIDLSANRQSAFDRGSWDLGFYMSNGAFRVILNSSTGMLARAIDKTDLAAVTAEDTLGFGNELSNEAIFAAITQETVPDWTQAAKTWIDDPSGDITKTAIAEVDATAGNNLVYIINRGKNADGSQRGWKKIKVTRNGTGYTLQHADISAATSTSVNIARNEAYNFTYVKFENGLVDLEPKKDRWDIAFTVYTNLAPVGPGLTVPYPFNDFVLQNTAGVETLELLTATAGSYEDFTADKLTGLTYSTSQVNIGAKWRSGGGPNTAPALRTDRFYLVKDAAGNIYKLKFTALTQNGERGRPQITFALLKKGSS